MHVYLIRHAKTNLNKGHIHQYPNTPLSEEGRESAVNLAEEIREMNPDFLVSSDYTRALETARIIGMHTGLTAQTSSLFFEIIRPTTLYGRSHFNIATFIYVVFSVFKRKDADWRYKDAENMSDILNRIQLAIDYLEKLDKKHKSVVVVSHSVFINLLVAHICKPGSLNFFELVQAFFKTKLTKNGSVTHIEFMGKKKGSNSCSWRQVR